MISFNGSVYFNKALVSSMYSIPIYTPRRSWHKVMIGPTNSLVTIISASTTGSSICSISDGSGRLDGLVTSTISPLVLYTWYTTPGAVVTRSKLYSRSSLSWITSRCSSPRKPHLKPKPRAMDVSASNCKDASFNCSFSKASLRSWYLAPSAGYSPQYTIGWTFLYPGSASSQGFSASVTVSPTLVPSTFFKLAVIYPTIPAVSSSQGINWPAPNVPTSTTSSSIPVAIIWIFVPFFTVPSNKRQNMITPL